MPIHFGVKVLPGKQGLNISREHYAKINPSSKRSSFFNARAMYIKKKQELLKII